MLQVVFVSREGERERVTVTSEFISLNGDEDEPNRDISAAAGLCFPPHYPHRVSQSPT